MEYRDGFDYLAVIAQQNKAIPKPNSIQYIRNTPSKHPALVIPPTSVTCFLVLLFRLYRDITDPAHFLELGMASLPKMRIIFSIEFAIIRARGFPILFLSQ
jgi:hypothetical protein